MSRGRGRAKSAGGGARWRAPGVVLAAALVGFFGARWIPSRSELTAAVRGALPLPDLTAFQVELERAAVASGVDPDLLRGLVAAESSGNPRARSAAGAMGLAQLMPATAEEERRRLGLPPLVDLFDPDVNLRLGASYLARMLASFGGEEAFAVAAYNAGPEPVKRWRKRAPDAAPDEVIRREGYAETRRHVERVLRYRDGYRAQRTPVR